jgi:hypothetical protein
LPGKIRGKLVLGGAPDMIFDRFCDEARADAIGGKSLPDDLGVAFSVTAAVPDNRDSRSPQSAQLTDPSAQAFWHFLRRLPQPSDAAIYDAGPEDDRISDSGRMDVECNHWLHGSHIICNGLRTSHEISRSAIHSSF